MNFRIIGQYYKMRNGNRAQITAHEDGSIYCIRVRLYLDHGLVEDMGYTIDGKIARENINEEHMWDLVEHWEQKIMAPPPPPVRRMGAPPVPKRRYPPPCPIKVPEYKPAAPQSPADYIRNAVTQLEHILLALTNQDIFLSLSIAHLLHERVKVHHTGFILPATKGDGKP